METKKSELDGLMALYQQKNQEFQEMLNETIQINKKIHRKKKKKITTIQQKEKRKFDDKLENVLLEISQTIPKEKKEEGIIEKLRKSFLIGSNRGLSNTNTSQDNPIRSKRISERVQSKGFNRQEKFGAYSKPISRKKISNRHFKEDYSLPSFARPYQTEQIQKKWDQRNISKRILNKKEKEKMRISDLEISDLSDGSKILREYQSKMRKKKMSEESEKIFVRDDSENEKGMGDSLGSRELDARLEKMEDHERILKEERERREQDELLDDSDELGSEESRDATIKLMNLSQINRDSNSSFDIKSAFDNQKKEIVRKSQLERDESMSKTSSDQQELYYTNNYHDTELSQSSIKKLGNHFILNDDDDDDFRNLSNSD